LHNWKLETLTLLKLIKTRLHPQTFTISNQMKLNTMTTGVFLRSSFKWGNYLKMFEMKISCNVCVNP